MLTYQLQPRIFNIQGKAKFEFPNTLTLELHYGPGTNFGTDSSPGRALVKGSRTTITYNSNTGRVLSESDPPLEPLEVVIESPNTKFELKGNILRYSAPCATPEVLDGIINALHFALPTLLNLSIPEPPVVLHTKGWLGDAEFRWEHREVIAPFHTVTTESLEKRVVEAFNQMQLFASTKNRRFFAALHYYHKACRLIVSGISDWEFMSEAILNMCKTMEILFVESSDSRDDIRKGLKKLSYDEESIEGDFIPLLILRGFVDVAHPKVAIYKSEQLFVLYRFLAHCESIFRSLLEKVIERISDGTFCVPEVSDFRLSPQDQAGMDALIDKIANRL